MLVDIESRRKKILGIIINTYINSGDPVGSRTICSKYGLELCPASIRNVMADLEELGLITHLHTSAGRIPTDKGYRFYVDELLEQAILSPQEELAINKEYINRQMVLEEIISFTSKVLSDFTHYAGLVSQPLLKRSRFQRIQFTCLGPKKICVILITNTGLTRSSILRLDNKINPQALPRIENFLNSQLEDTPLSQLKTKLRRMMIQERNSFFYILKQAIELIDLSSLINDNARFYFEGAGNILNFPEFENSAKTKSFLKVIEEKKTLIELIQEAMEEEPSSSSVKILIGKENPWNILEDFSVILSSYKIGDQIVGGLGVIGPKRMDYAKSIATVKYVSKILSQTLTEFNL